MPPAAIVRILLLSLSCGVALALCLPRPGLCFLAWFSLAPLFVFWSESTAKKSFAVGWAAGFGFHGLALYWIYSTCRFAGIAAPIAVLAWAALAAFLAFNWGVIGALGCALARGLPRPWRPWVWAVVWTGLTVAAERWTPRLCLDILGYTQYKNLSLLQISALMGPYALGFLVVAFNAALAAAWKQVQGGEKSDWIARNLAIAAALIIAIWGYGLYELERRMTAGTSARVEILQPAIDQYQKWDPAFEQRILGNFLELLSRPRAESPALIIWPESSLPRWVREGEIIPEAADWSRKLGAFQVLGAVSKFQGRTYNSALLIGGDGRPRAAYHKRRLVPFGEFVPFSGFFRRFIGILNELGGMAVGERAQGLLRTPLGPAAASICYEAAFPRLAREDVKRGARWIINVTNDGWYKDTWGPYQHFYVNLFRAIENRVTVIRAGNSGISAVIDPWGIVTAQLELNRRGRLDARVITEDFFPARSFYARHGDLFGLLNLGVLAALLLAAMTKKRLAWA